MPAVAEYPQDPKNVPADETSLIWSVWPARRRPGIALLVGIVVLVTALFVAQVAASVWAGILGGVLLVWALRQFFFATIYRIDADGVSIQCLVHRTHRPWRRIRRFRHDAQGALLATGASPGFLDRFSGMHLTWNANRDEAVRLIESFMGNSAGLSDPCTRESAACGTG